MLAKPFAIAQKLYAPARSAATGLRSGEKTASGCRDNDVSKVLRRPYLVLWSECSTLPLRGNSSLQNPYGKADMLRLASAASLIVPVEARGRMIPFARNWGGPFRCCKIATNGNQFISFGSGGGSGKIGFHPGGCVGMGEISV
jgi:hypothetical protein